MQAPAPGSWRLESNEFEREVAMAIISNPDLECLDIMMFFDTSGERTDDRSVEFTRADIVRVILLPEKQQRLLHRKFFFEKICRVVTKEHCEFPDAQTVIVDVDSFKEEHLIDLARNWLVSHGYELPEFLWGPQMMSTKRGG